MKKFWFLFFLAPALLKAQAVPTVAPTAPPTAVPTPTATVTPLVLFTPTATGTSTHSFTPTNTGTITFTPTETNTGTLPTKTNTPTVTHTYTPTVTGTLPTKTATPTVTMTFTLTATPGIVSFSVSAKPEPDGKIKFKWESTFKAKEVDVKIFTTGYRLVRQFNYDRHEHGENLNPGEHEIFWDGKDEEDRPMPAGNYLCFVEAMAEKKTYESSAMTNIP